MRSILTRTIPPAFLFPKALHHPEVFLFRGAFHFPGRLLIRARAILHFLLLLLLLSVFPSLTVFSLAAQPEDGRYLYLSMPDGAQTEGRSGSGILIFDMDDDFRFVRRIGIPHLEEGVRGFTGILAIHTAYFSTSNHRVGAFDLETEQVVWDRTYHQGADRSSITMDGKKLFVPTGWWYSGDDSGMLVLDAGSGELLDWIRVASAAHNSIVSLDGERVYLGTGTILSVFDSQSDEMILQVKDVGERGVFPFTFDSEERYAYVCLGGHIGFDVVDLETGEIPYRVYPEGKRIAHRTHGIALTPDERELWISDQEGKRLFIFDATRMPPLYKGFVELSDTGHGWGSFSLDGEFVLTHTPDVSETATRKRVALLRDENGNPVSGSKFIEVHFRNGKVVVVGNEFGLGRMKLSKSEQSGSGDHSRTMKENRMGERVQVRKTVHSPFPEQSPQMVQVLNRMQDPTIDLLLKGGHVIRSRTRIWATWILEPRLMWPCSLSGTAGSGLWTDSATGWRAHSFLKRTSPSGPDESSGIAMDEATRSGMNRKRSETEKEKRADPVRELERERK